MLAASPSTRLPAIRCWMAAAILLAGPTAAWAQNALTISAAQVDRPTLQSLGVRLPFSGDANQNSAIGVEYRVATGGTVSSWQPGLALWRVHPEVVTQQTVPQAFAGSVFNLTPGTSYDIALTVSDPDGVRVNNRLVGASYRQVLSGLTADGQPVAGLTTRTVPSDPAAATVINVTTAQQLTTALNGAQPGQIIQLAPGTYSGRWQIVASGTAANPIVIRGANWLDSDNAFSNGTYLGAYHDLTVLDGEGCTDCNVLEV
jgi:hypothetical protein